MVVQVENDLRLVLGTLGIVDVTAVGPDAIAEQGGPGELQPG